MGLPVGPATDRRIVMGVDWARGGWAVVVAREAGPDRLEYVHAQTYDSLLKAYLANSPECMAIDVPIGLPVPNGVVPLPERRADPAARRVLPRRAKPSVFRVPPREVLEVDDHAAASALSFRLTGKKLSKQSFELRGPILEAEGFAAASFPVRLVEVHPELAFLHLGGREVVEHRKVSYLGVESRRRALEGAGLVVEANSELGGAGVDDVLDAAVAAWTALRVLQGTALSFPERPPESPHDEGRIWA